MTIHFEA